MTMEKGKIATMYKAFSDENRIIILDILKDGEKCACKILELMDISQPTLSHHMRILLDAEVVKSRKEGKWIHYSLSQEGIDTCLEYLSELMLKAKFSYKKQDWVLSGK